MASAETLSTLYAVKRKRTWKTALVVQRWDLLCLLYWELCKVFGFLCLESWELSRAYLHGRKLCRIVEIHLCICWPPLHIGSAYFQASHAQAVKLMVCITQWIEKAVHTWEPIGVVCTKTPLVAHEGGGCLSCHVTDIYPSFSNLNDPLRSIELVFLEKFYHSPLENLHATQR